MHDISPERFLLSWQWTSTGCCAEQYFWSIKESPTFFLSRGDHMADVICPIFLFSIITGHGREQVGHLSSPKITPRISFVAPLEAIFSKAGRPR